MGNTAQLEASPVPRRSLAGLGSNSRGVAHTCSCPKVKGAPPLLLTELVREKPAGLWWGRAVGLGAQRLIHHHAVTRQDSPVWK